MLKRESYCYENEESRCFTFTSLNIEIINKNTTTTTSIKNDKQINKNTTTNTLRINEHKIHQHEE